MAVAGRGQTNVDSVGVPETTHSPVRALTLSLLPGAGQVYNGQAWKVPIIYTAFGALGYLIYDNYSRMSMFKEEYLYRINEGSARLEGYTSYPNSSIYNLYQSYNKNFQLMIIISVAVYGLNLIDAYVFGHLYDFQIDDNLSLHAAPTLLYQNNTGFGFAPAMELTFTF